MDITIPEVGESVREALLAKWFRQQGEFVRKDEPLCEIETDKITLDLNADASGILTIAVAEGTTVPIGRVIGSIAESDAAETAPLPAGEELRRQAEAPPTSPSLRREMRAHGVAPDEVPGSGRGGRVSHADLFSYLDEQASQPPVSRPASTEPMPVAVAPPEPEPQPAGSTVPEPVLPPVMPPRVVMPSPPVAPAVAPSPVTAPNSSIDRVNSEEPPPYGESREERHPLSPLRQRIAERLVAARQQTAMLTTFNEADMSAVQRLRERYRQAFIDKYGLRLGYMPFFVAACCRALKQFPAVNARIDGSDLVFHHDCNIGVAVSGEKGLVVPVLRSAERMAFHEIEAAIRGFSERIATHQLALSDLEGGTFSISNGGIYGSLLSTPILNPPQSGVLGMHAIQERPVAREGAIVIRPMMYLALSYDHRVIDGREAVGFLKRVIELIEAPDDLLQGGLRGEFNV